MLRVVALVAAFCACNAPPSEPTYPEFPIEELRDGGPVDAAPAPPRDAAVVPVCGDGLITGDEVCDDRNTLDGDYCAGDCSMATGRCGDGIIQPNEGCDGVLPEGVHEDAVCGSLCQVLLPDHRVLMVPRTHAVCSHRPDLSVRCAGEDSPIVSPRARFSLVGAAQGALCGFMEGERRLSCMASPTCARCVANARGLEDWEPSARISRILNTSAMLVFVRDDGRVEARFPGRAVSYWSYGEDEYVFARIAHIGAGIVQGCGLRADGRLRCWTRPGFPDGIDAVDVDPAGPHAPEPSWISTAGELQSADLSGRIRTYYTDVVSFCDSTDGDFVLRRDGRVLSLWSGEVVSESRYASVDCEPLSGHFCGVRWDGVAECWTRDGGDVALPELFGGDVDGAGSPARP